MIQHNGKQSEQQKTDSRNNEKSYGMYIPDEAAMQRNSAAAEQAGTLAFPPEMLQGYTSNDAGNARRFLDVQGDNVRYCAVEKQWYLCQSNYSWKPDIEKQVEKLAYETVSSSYHRQLRYYHEIDVHHQLKNLIAELEKNQRNIGNLSVLRSCIGMAEKEVPITPDAFDRQQHLFHVQNGTVDLQQFGCVPAEREHYITKTADVSYHCEAECPRWEQFVLACCQGDMQLYRYLQKLAAYTVLSGDISEQMIVCLFGSGSNGKSLFINTLAAIAGDYACKIDSAIISMTSRGEKDYDTSKELYRMRGCRLVYASEFNKNTLLNEAFVKAITDGGKISCRPLYGAYVEYQPTYTLWFSTNNAPALTGMDNGMQRRFVLIPFYNQVEEPDKTLPDALRQEASGILNWLMEGYWLYTQEGLEAPDVVRAATAEYMNQQDVYQQFVEQCYRPDSGGKLYAKTVYRQYTAWCMENGEKPVSQIALSKELQRLGIERRKDRVSSYYCLCENTVHVQNAGA